MEKNKQIEETLKALFRIVDDLKKLGYSTDDINNTIKAYIHNNEISTEGKKQ